MKAEIHNSWAAVEVRSSYVEQKCFGISDRSDLLECIQRKYNLLAHYKTANKKGETPKHGELPKVLFFQVYWTHSQAEAEQIYTKMEKEGREPLECYIVGYATRNLVKKKGKTSSLNQQGASYKLVPISIAFPCTRLATLKYK